MARVVIIEYEDDLKFRFERLVGGNQDGYWSAQIWHKSTRTWGARLEPLWNPGDVLWEVVQATHDPKPTKESLAP